MKIGQFRIYRKLVILHIHNNKYVWTLGPFYYHGNIFQGQLYHANFKEIAFEQVKYIHMTTDTKKNITPKTNLRFFVGWEFFEALRLHQAPVGVLTTQPGCLHARTQTIELGGYVRARTHPGGRQVLCLASVKSELHGDRSPRGQEGGLPWKIFLSSK